MYLKNKPLIKMSLTAFLITTLPACGGSSGGGGDDGDSDTKTSAAPAPSTENTNTEINLTPVTPLTSKNKISISLDNGKTTTLKTEFGFEGDIQNETHKISMKTSIIQN
jgi:hypothetical protein